MLRDDFTLVILKAEEGGDLEAVECGEVITKGKWRAACLYDDTNDVFQLGGEDEEEEEGSVLLFLLGREGDLQVGPTGPTWILDVNEPENRSFASQA